MKRYKRNIEESSLSRVWRHNLEHDCGAITAFRKYSDCDGSKGHPYSKRENLQRNKSLTAKLLSLDYGITKLHGRYPEGGTVGKEVSYFVVDLLDKGNLERDLRRLGEEFDQDSVLIIPKGTINNEAEAFLIGTNHCDNNWLGYGKKESFQKGRLGYESPIYTSYVNGRPFIFESVGKEVRSPASGMGVWAMRRMAEKHWTELSILLLILNL